MARTSGSHAKITGPKIQEAAQRLFARHGYAAVSMRQIATEVGVQVGALYNYTPDKQTLLVGLMTSHLEELLSAWGQEGAVATAAARLEQFTRFHIRFHKERPDAVFIAYMELRNLTPKNFETVEVLRRRYEGALEEILRSGVTEGAFAIADTKVATMGIIAMLTGLNTWFREDGRLSFDEVEDLYWGIVRNSVGLAG
ncbi:TetR/AcrR family transcriptional regulator [Cognatishimia sp.]|uniref:TetR/AcrR family transcriptional regulator n=1 Tax=Cognatishimia sp. TaxID=2211648 RepID=UPI0035198FFA|nr:TetR/AcrR family transcriptional regulator [Cognatishimia sp.]